MFRWACVAIRGDGAGAPGSLAGLVWVFSPARSDRGAATLLWTRAWFGRYRVAAMGLGRGRGGWLQSFGPAVLMPVGAFGVHQLRYYLAYGSAAGAMLQRTGHSYLHSVVPWLVVLLAVALGGFLGALGRAVAGQRSLGRYAVSLLGLWIVCATCLIAIFATQEFLEGLFATGHPAGLAGIFGYGGWLAIPAALCIGLVLAALFHGALWVLDEVAGRHARPRAQAKPCPAPALFPVEAVLLRLAPLADGCSRRGPPSVS